MDASPSPVPALRASAPVAGAALVVVAAVLGCALYANLSFLVTDPGDYGFFPPFERGRNQNHNNHLGGEYYNIATALVSGQGYADPFRRHTGPTAWMPPILSGILAALRWSADGDTEAVAAAVVVLQVLTLIGTGVLVLALARQTTGQVWTAAVVFLMALAYNFRLSFQFTHDCWIVLAAIDLLVAGLVWARPLQGSWVRAAGWGIFGGLAALCSPVVGFVWGCFALSSGWRSGQRARFAVAVLMAVLTVAPWVIRNYLVLGRFIPVKSNLAFELYQSQCLVPDGVLQGAVFAVHPYANDNPERREYARLGELEYLDRKWDLFCASVEADPADFAARVASRFCAATFVYVPYEATEELRRPGGFWFNRLTYPLPFLCLLVLLATAYWRPLAPAQWIAMGVYVTYLFPYVLVSYYDRYKYPLLGVEVALIVWGIARIWQLWTLSRGPEPAPGDLS